MNSDSDALADLYEKFPYPPPPAAGRIWKRRTESLKEEGRKIARHFLSFSAAEKGGRYLDAGCGTGAKLAGFASALPGSTVLGIDGSSASIETALGLLDGEAAANVSLQTGDLSSSEFLDSLGEFDGIICDGVLHHLHDPPGTLRALSCMLKPGGLFYISVFSRVGRPYHARIREILKLSGIGPGPTGPGIKLARSLLDLGGLVDRRHGKYYQDDAFLADAFLNPMEERFDVGWIFDRFEENGISFLEWPSAEGRLGELKAALRRGGIAWETLPHRAILSMFEYWKAPSMITCLGRKESLPGNR
jgi:SAM-dependent methyltransferase